MLNESGHEVLDDTPVAVPLRFSRPPSKMDEMRAMFKLMLRENSNSDLETPEEAEDFEIGDDYDPRSPFEFERDNESLDEPAPPLVDEEPAPAPAPQGDGDAVPIKTPAD